jgi:glycosyltransferase involved in cell wall biosynthesis
MPRLSVIIITKNEAANIAECLDSVAFADERIVLDSGSTDGTPDIARARGARVEVTSDWPGFGAQKNRALALASGDWVLSIDADERVSPALAAEIREAIDASRAAVYAMPRLSSFCGRFMRHGGWYPDHVTRLFRRGEARFSDDLVHERLVSAQPAARLSNHLIHYSYLSLEDVIAKLNAYSSGRARDLAARGRKGGLLRALLHAKWTFIRGYILRRGFMDGRHGLILALYNAETTYYRYLKMSGDYAGRPPLP